MVIILNFTSVKISIQNKGCVLFMSYKEDIRIQKTRRELRNAMVKLLEEKSIEKISVTEICDEALVNRMTFYKYYEDKYTLLGDLFNEFKDEIFSEFPNDDIKTIDDVKNSFKKLMAVIIDFIEKNKKLIIALESSPNDRLYKITADIGTSAIMDLIVKLNKIKPLKYNHAVAASFIYGGSMAVITYLIHHPKELDDKELALFINDISNLFENEILYK